MSREQKIEKARELRAEGCGYKEIGERLGVSTTSAYRWLNPERVAPYRNGRACDPDHARTCDRDYYRRTRRDCPSCGQPMAHTSSHCIACIEDEADRVRRQIVAWWNEGLPIREICQRLNWTNGHFSVVAHRMRELGYDLPYRYQLHKHGPRFPDQGRMTRNGTPDHTGPEAVAGLSKRQADKRLCRLLPDDHPPLFIGVLANGKVAIPKATATEGRAA